MKKILVKPVSMIICVCLITAAAGCGRVLSANSRDPDLIGEWAEGIFDTGYIFNEDLTGEDTFWLLSFTYTARDGTLIIRYDDSLWGKSSYSYTISGNVLTMTGESGNAFSYTKRN